MEKIIIKGGNPLYGSVSINGAKNAALPVICACILNKETCIIDNIPPVNDIMILLDILKAMGAEVKMLAKNSVSINCANIVPCSSPNELASKLRGSSYILGAELGRFGKASVYSPGGCSIGPRPLDLHMHAFESLGAHCTHRNGRIEVEAEDKLEGNTVFFGKVSVGATVNTILASVMAEGTTIIDNAAREPHIVDLCVFLNACGANIYGAGTSVIKVKGVKSLHGCRHFIIPDMIEAGTFMTAVGATGGKITVKNVIPRHLDAISAKLKEAGVSVTEGDDFVIDESTGDIKPVSITTQAYPGFATDMQPQFATMLCFAKGTSDIHETIFENRFQYMDELTRMGADLKVTSNTAIIRGGAPLSGAPLKCHDLRAGAAMVIAALAAEGESELHGIDKIERGYYNITEKFASLGANIRKIYEYEEDTKVATV